MNRRSFLRRTTAGFATLPFQKLLARAQAGEVTSASGRRSAAGYGPLIETRDLKTGLPLLWLPAGFKYVSFGWVGDPLVDGRLTPGAHDGMGAFSAGRYGCYLVRNHEVGAGTPFSPVTYDAQGGGGTTTLEFDTRRGELRMAYASLGGTIRNCAGGRTPWRTWLTCEETTDYTSMPHGYVFEVPPVGFGHPVPIRDMGRFSHEAVAVDPSTGYVYETEDSDDRCGFYRFVPDVNGRLAAGGSLFMLRVTSAPGVNLGTSYPTGISFDVDWVRIEQPDDPTRGAPSTAVWRQGRAQGAATFSRLEGCWYERGTVYFVASKGGRGFGQIWEYTPSTERLRLLFESPDASVLDSPDNVTVSPRGGLVLCEDGDGEQYVQGLTSSGEVFPFARNNVRLTGERNGLAGDFTHSEFAGACYSPDGHWLFVNILQPGITVAITGPWRRGAL